MNAETSSGTLLVVNCGSSSLKMAVYTADTETLLASALAERLGTAQARIVIKQPQAVQLPIPAPADHDTAIAAVIDQFRALGVMNEAPLGIGHRTVHGGELFTEASLIDETALDHMRACIPLAPLHAPANLSGIEATRRLFPDTPQVAVFDTAFHQTLSRRAYLYALPYELYENHGVRRYGFHGTSHRFITQSLAHKLDLAENQVSLICAHLGNGCSITAVRDGCSVDTSMGLTPLEGLVMGTRSGDVDPGLFDFLGRLGHNSTAIDRMLNRESGLQGLSGLSNDMRTLEQAAAQGHERARLAIDIFCFRLAKYIGAMMVSLNRLDGLVFTGGIGENSALVRAQTLSHLCLLGFELDEDANREHGQTRNGCISAVGTRPVWVIPTNEELLIARDTLSLIRHATSI